MKNYFLFVIAVISAISLDARFDQQGEILLLDNQLNRSIERLATRQALQEELRQDEIRARRMQREIVSRDALTAEQIEEIRLHNRAAREIINDQRDLNPPQGEGEHSFGRSLSFDTFFPNGLPA